MKLKPLTIALISALALITVVTGVQAGSRVGFFDLTDKQIINGGIDLLSRGVNLAVGDLGKDGFAEVVIGGYSGSAPTVSVYRGDGSMISEWLVYDKKFTGGVNVALGDIDGDGVKEIITGAGEGGGAHIRIFSGRGEAKNSFFAYDKNYNLGIKISAGDINNDGQDEILVTPGFGVTPEIKVFSGAGKLLNSFPVTDFGSFSGVKAMCGDLGGDGFNEILVFGSYGASSTVGVYRTDGSLIKNINIDIGGGYSGVNILPFDINNDKKDELIVATNFLGDNQIRVLAPDGSIINQFAPVIDNYDRGYNLGIGDIDADGEDEIIFAPQSSRERDMVGRLIDINVRLQKMFLYEDGYRLAERVVSTGKVSTPTKLGTFKVLSKHEMAYGSGDGQKWAMPKFIGFYRVGGVENGIHALPYIDGVKEGINSLGRAVSHGCVRLADAAAAQLFDWVAVGDLINVHK